MDTQAPSNMGGMQMPSVAPISVAPAQQTPSMFSQPPAQQTPSMFSQPPAQNPQQPAQNPYGSTPVQQVPGMFANGSKPQWRPNNFAFDPSIPQIPSDGRITLDWIKTLDLSSADKIGNASVLVHGTVHTSKVAFPYTGEALAKRLEARRFQSDRSPYCEITLKNPEIILRGGNTPSLEQQIIIAHLIAKGNFYHSNGNPERGWEACDFFRIDQLTRTRVSNKPESEFTPEDFATAIPQALAIDANKQYHYVALEDELERGSDVTVLVTPWKSQRTENGKTNVSAGVNFEKLFINQEVRYWNRSRNGVDPTSMGFQLAPDAMESINTVRQQQIAYITNQQAAQAAQSQQQLSPEQVNNQMNPLASPYQQGIAQPVQPAQVMSAPQGFSQNAYGQQPAADAYGQQPVAGAYGQQPSQQPAAGAYGQQPSQQPAAGAYGQQPSQQPVAGAYGQQPVAGAYGQQPVQETNMPQGDATYGTMPPGMNGGIVYNAQ
jgi:hypothetical protein